MIQKLYFENATQWRCEIVHFALKLKPGVIVWAIFTMIIGFVACILVNVQDKGVIERWLGKDKSQSYSVF